MADSDSDYEQDVEVFSKDWGKGHKSFYGGSDGEDDVQDGDVDGLKLQEQEARLQQQNRANRLTKSDYVGDFDDLLEDDEEEESDEEDSAEEEVVKKKKLSSRREEDVEVIDMQKNLTRCQAKRCRIIYIMGFLETIYIVGKLYTNIL